jgi:hypothetical protein
MTMRWDRIIGVALLGTVVILALAAYRWRMTQDHDQYSLSEVLWTRDASGNLHEPGSSSAKQMLVRLQSAGINTDEREYQPYVLVNEGAAEHMEDGEPLLILNWRPQKTDGDR